MGRIISRRISRQRAVSLRDLPGDGGLSRGEFVGATRLQF